MTLSTNNKGTPNGHLFSHLQEDKVNNVCPIQIGLLDEVRYILCENCVLSIWQGPRSGQCDPYHTLGLSPSQLTEGRFQNLPLHLSNQKESNPKDTELTPRNGALNILSQSSCSVVFCWYNGSGAITGMTPVTAIEPSNAVHQHIQGIPDGP